MSPKINYGVGTKGYHLKPGDPQLGTPLLKGSRETPQPSGSPTGRREDGQARRTEDTTPGVATVISSTSEHL